MSKSSLARKGGESPSTREEPANLRGAAKGLAGEEGGSERCWLGGTSWPALVQRESTDGTVTGEPEGTSGEGFGGEKEPLECLKEPQEAELSMGLFKEMERGGRSLATTLSGREARSEEEAWRGGVTDAVIGADDEEAEEEGDEEEAIGDEEIDAGAGAGDEVCFST